MTDRLTDAQLVERAVHNATHYSLSKWGAVQGVFAVGSTSARALCERFGFKPYDSAETAKSSDPWQEARRPVEPAAMQARHEKSGRIYTVVEFHARMEHDQLPAVVYRGDDGAVWVRPQTEFCEKFAFIGTSAAATAPASAVTSRSMISDPIERALVLAVDLAPIEDREVLVACERGLEAYRAAHPRDDSARALLNRAAEILEREAEAIAIANTLNGEWVVYDEEAKAEHDEMLEVAQQLAARARGVS